MKVNMTPNPLDVVTIHASQGDTEARQWEFELHNNGELIDTSEITEQLFFKSYKGGTEQILPENTSTPTTSPFKGDIKYPQGLLTDQEFTYRQSPTEKDGNAKITDIKGNTLNWNQLVQNGNFADTSKWGYSEQYVSSFTVSNNEAKIVANVNYAQINQSNFSVIAGHKYFCSLTAKCSNGRRIGMNVTGSGMSFDYEDMTSNYAIINKIKTAVSDSTNYLTVAVSGSQNGDEIYVKNIMLFDLTKMGLDSIASVEEFTSLFPLSYYSYNQGSLLSFNGNGIKTVGINHLPRLVAGSYSLNGITANVDNDGYISVSGNAYAGGTSISIPLEESFKLQKGMWCHAFNNRAEASITPTLGSWYFSLTPINRIAQCPDIYDGTVATNIRLYIGANINPNITLRPMLAFTNEVTPYEPCTSSTLSLPISTYFPSGMKSAGTVYDELLPNKAITRVGSIDLGSMSWTAVTQKNIIRMRSYDIKTLIKYPSANNQIANMKCARYMSLTANNTYDGQIGISCQNNGDIYVYDSAYSTAEAFTTAMSGVYLYYELATPTETSFTTASLVTENAEIPLSNEDGTLIGKCTEQLSENPGFFDAKIKLSDSDGECYSNKIQLHVERSPQ